MLRSRLARGGPLFVLLVAALASAMSLAAPAGADVLVFAAASTTAPLADVATLYEGQGHGRVTAAHAASSTLARQIIAGAPADIYVSAHPAWMDYLSENDAVEPRSRKVLLTNRLVLIAPRERAIELGIAPGFALVDALDGGRLALGDPDHVPAGLYAKAALAALGVWPEVSGHVVAMPDVRAALAVVDRGEAPLGIVYASDARLSDRVRVVDTFPRDTHPPIVYPAAILAERDRAEVRRFYDFLSSLEAMAVFEEYGFDGPDAPRGDRDRG